MIDKIDMSFIDELNFSPQTTKNLYESLADYDRRTYFTHNIINIHHSSNIDILSTKYGDHYKESSLISQLQRQQGATFLDKNKDASSISPRDTEFLIEVGGE